MQFSSDVDKPLWAWWSPRCWGIASCCHPKQCSCSQSTQHPLDHQTSTSVYLCHQQMYPLGSKMKECRQSCTQHRYKICSKMFLICLLHCNTHYEVSTILQVKVLLMKLKMCMLWLSMLLWALSTNTSGLMQQHEKEFWKEKTKKLSNHSCVSWSNSP